MISELADSLDACKDIFRFVSLTEMVLELGRPSGNAEANDHSSSSVAGAGAGAGRLFVAGLGLAKSNTKCLQVSMYKYGQSYDTWHRRLW